MLFFSPPHFFCNSGRFLLLEAVMKTNSVSRSAFFNPRLVLGFVLCSIGVLLALAGWSKSVTGNPAATSAETQNTLFRVTNGDDNAPSASGALRSSTAGNNNTPPPRFAPGIAYDAARGVVVMFGGFYYDGTYIWRNDTWTWDGTTWTEQNPVTSPAERSRGRWCTTRRVNKLSCSAGADTASPSMTLGPGTERTGLLKALKTHRVHERG